MPRRSRFTPRRRISSANAVCAPRLDMFAPQTRYKAALRLDMFASQTRYVRLRGLDMSPLRVTRYVAKGDIAEEKSRSDFSIFIIIVFRASEKPRFMPPQAVYRIARRAIRTRAGRAPRGSICLLRKLDTRPLCGSICLLRKLDTRPLCGSICLLRKLDMSACADSICHPCG